ncbi:hypothetical protein [Salinicoccus albus]|uniref:hypothetical protein n=1 Tax=Salinicoccus albus TaxID=418756 RepID=UPI00037EEC5D|nr:hypothetical protein [Salinicoccus albus]
MEIKNGDSFNFIFPNGETGTIKVTAIVDNHIVFQHTNGKTMNDSINEDYFFQLIESGYFKKGEIS